MKVDPRIVDPFNAWWPSYGGHCEAEPKVIKAFEAGFRAGLKYGVDAATAVINGESSALPQPAEQK